MKRLLRRTRVRPGGLQQNFFKSSCRRAVQNFRNVLYLHGAFLPAQDPFQMHQATHIAAGNNRCAMRFVIL
jgi:hypothetical protein